MVGYSKPGLGGWVAYPDKKTRIIKMPKYGI